MNKAATELPCFRFFYLVLQTHRHDDVPDTLVVAAGYQAGTAAVGDVQLDVVAADGGDGINEVVDVQRHFQLQVLRVDDFQRFVGGLVFEIARRQLQAGFAEGKADTVVAVQQ